MHKWQDNNGNILIIQNGNGDIGSVMGMENILINGILH